jgi:molybdenum cofactor biosynthesis enzyme MoaA
VLGRWECPVAVDAACNARCLGCISRQPVSSGIAPPQDRIDFVPTVEEIVEYTVPHLERAARPIVSFGQGCEGEPLLQADLIAEAVRAIRRRTRRGILNINTNGSRPEAVERLCDAGLDSIRVSLNSAQPALYEAFYRPRGYGFRDVAASIRAMRSRGKWVSLNYLIFPGFTDTAEEAAALEGFIRRTTPSMLQVRSLNIDPEWYVGELDLAARRGRPLGMRSWLDRLRASFPLLRIGCFNPASFSARVCRASPREML